MNRTTWILLAQLCFFTGVASQAQAEIRIESRPNPLEIHGGDYEAQVGQNAITLHSMERLSSSDRGISMVRRLWKEQLEVVASGGDPVGVSFDQDAGPVSLVAGNYIQ